MHADEKMATGRMLPLILRMALPCVAAQLVNLLYHLVDKIYIGHIAGEGDVALAGVGVTGSVIVLISAFSSIVGGGGSPLAAIALGRGDREEAHRIMNTGFVMLGVFTVFCMGAAYGFMRPLLRFAGASDVTYSYAADYLSVYLIGAFPVMVSTGMNLYINAQGRPGVAMLPVLLGAALNTALDPLFIFRFGLGVRGAAIATVLSQTVSALWILAFLCSPHAQLRLVPRLMRLDFSVVKRIVALGISPFAMSATESLVGFALNGTLAQFGDIYVSALTVMQSAMQVVSVPLQGFGQGASPVVSYNYGRGDTRRVREAYRVILAIMFSVNFLVILFMILLPGLVASLFTDKEELVGIVRQYMPLFLAGMTIFGLQRACQNTFVALGQSKVSLFIALLRKVFLLIPLVLILSRIWGVSGVYAAEAIADATAALTCTGIFFFLFPRILRACEKAQTPPDAERITPDAEQTLAKQTTPGEEQPPRR